MEKASIIITKIMYTGINLGKLFGDANPYNKTQKKLDLDSKNCVQDQIVILIKNALIVMIAVLLIIGIIMVIIAGIKLITSGGVPDLLAEGITSFKNALLGVALAFIVVLIIYFIANIAWPGIGTDSSTSLCEPIEEEP